jgi:hypothetical protein
MVRFFWVELLCPGRIGLGSTLVPYFHPFVTQYASTLFPVSMENRDLG